MEKNLFLLKDIKKGITDPLDPITFPYLTIEKIVLSVFFLLAAMKSLSEANFVAPYKLTGLHALSVDKAITFYFI